MKTRISTILVAMLIAATTMIPASARCASPESFSLAWSEYPSWSAIEVASVFKLIDGKKGKMGPIETKWGVDIELKLMDYDPCMTAYSAFQVDAVCITNMDVLNPALSRPSVAILPTSTSVGADALLVDPSVTDASQLKGINVYGLSKSVSEYCFARNIQKLGLNPSDFNFTNMDPAAAATLFQQKRNGYSAIMVWNPFVLDSLKKRKDARVLFSSEAIPNEIIDMVVVAESTLKKPKGEAFACALIDAYYGINEKLADPSISDDVLVAIGEKFSSLALQDMRTVVKQTRFFGNAKDGIAVFENPGMKTTMDTIVAFCVDNKIVDAAPAIVFGPASGKTNLRFDTTYMKRVAEKK